MWLFSVLLASERHTDHAAQMDLFQNKGLCSCKSNKITTLKYIFQNKKVLFFAGEMNFATVTILVRNHDATGCPYDDGQHENRTK